MNTWDMRERNIIFTPTLVMGLRTPNKVSLIIPSHPIARVGVSHFMSSDQSIDPGHFNLIEHSGETALTIHPNAMAYWSLVQQERMTAQKHISDTMTGHRSVEAVAQGGEKPHAAPLERTDKLAQVNTPFK